MPQRFKFTVPAGAPRLRTISFAALRVAPWVVFGPITGVMSEAALGAFRKGRPVLGGIYILANLTILVSMPVATALLVAHH
jgi:hypothetical protein